MLKFNFSRVLKARDIEKPYSYFAKHGFSPNTATRMANEKIKVLNLKHVERLCLLWQCTPNDLLEWVPDRYSDDTSVHPLNELLREEKGIDIRSVLNAVPISKLAEVEKMIKEKIQQ